jgi:hypothetical protein
VVDIKKLMVMIRLREVEVPCVLNIAAVNIKIKEYEKAMDQCNKVRHETRSIVPG